MLGPSQRLKQPAEAAGALLAAICFLFGASERAPVVVVGGGGGEGGVGFQEGVAAMHVCSGHRDGITVLLRRARAAATSPEKKRPRRKETHRHKPRAIAIRAARPTRARRVARAPHVDANSLALARRAPVFNARCRRQRARVGDLREVGRAPSNAFAR